MQNKLGLYVHYPFCLRKCPYCDFNSHIRKTAIDVDEYISAYIRDLTTDAKRIHPKPLSSIFFGGGTPSLMAVKMVEKIIDSANYIFGFTNDIEITLEANPTSFGADKFNDFKTAGVNRVSLGVQSLNDNDLQYLGREHTADEALRAVATAQNIFNRWSFDMIYARPQQTLSAWESELTTAIDYIGGHISLYQLTIEDGTDFKRKFERGEIIMPSEQLSTDMYNFTNQLLAAKNYNAYEVSNYAKTGDESRHNKIYWNYDDYIGIGAGAHGRLSDIKGNKYATVRHRVPEKWLKDASYDTNEVIDKTEQATETILMGLRLSEGVAEQKINSITGGGFETVLDMQRVQVAVQQGLLERTNQTIKPTHQGRLKLNSLLSYIIR